MLGDYIGELNSDGQAHGEGTFDEDRGFRIHNAIFKNNVMDGFCKYLTRSFANFVDRLCDIQGSRARYRRSPGWYVGRQRDRLPEVS